MAGRPEQKRRSAAVAVASKRARNQALREVLELAERGDTDLIIGFCQAELGMTKPIEEVRCELKPESVH